MTIKLRLLLSYISIVVIQILLVVGITFLFGCIKIEDENIDSDFSLPGKTFGHFILDTNSLNREIDIHATVSKDKLLTPSYLNELESKIQKYGAGIIIRKNDEIIYKSLLLSAFDENNYLPDFLEPFRKKDFSETNKAYDIFIQKDFYYKNSEVSMFIVVNWDSVYKKEAKARNLIAGVFVILFIASTIIITMFIYRDINRSIHNLKVAANEIKKGNLDFKVNKDLNDELGELCDAFEQMRIKIKESNTMKEKYEKNRKNLISNISHDLKTPMMSIKGHIEGIKDGVADTPDKMNKYIGTIYEKAKIMESLINELLLFSRLDLQREEFNFEKIDIIEFLEYSVEDLSYDLEKIGGSIIFNHSMNSAYVNGDLQKLTRVILNIIDNAVKYKGEQPLKVKINVTQKEQKIIIEIRDNGIGISKEHLPFIFDRFYRVDPSRNTDISGTGLGLAISKQIIQQHDGEMWVKSIELEGTQIYISLKVIEDVDLGLL